MRRYLIYIAALLLTTACSSGRAIDPSTIYVSILPLKGLVKAITGQDFPVEVLVPPGASPETFEPTPRQYIGLNEAQWVFSTGLIDFETTLLAKIDRHEKVVNLSQGIELIAGCCSHHHHGHAHAHGIDPHIWTSPRALRQMAATLYEQIHAAYPDSTRYTLNFKHLDSELEQLDQRTAERIAAAAVTEILVYHPALTYYARDYGLQQRAIEQDGKEPSARQLGELIRHARAAKVRTILYQQQFPRSSVETIAADIGAKAVEFNPLAEDVIANIDHITLLITER